MSAEAPLFIQIYTDEHVSPLIAQTLRRRGFVAQSAIEIGMIGRSDEEHLAYAADHAMAILTFDQVDFVQLAQQWAAAQREHAGIIISPQLGSRQMSQLLQSLSRLLDTLTADELHNQVVFLQQFGAHRPRIAETRAEYEAGLVNRGSVADLMVEVAE
jgi:predicted nuclease of predicted toxin-antitoxin system